MKTAERQATAAKGTFVYRLNDETGKKRILLYSRSHNNVSTVNIMLKAFIDEVAVGKRNHNNCSRLENTEPAMGAVARMRSTIS